MTDLERLLLASHRFNIRRYRRTLLDASLTDFERQFFEHRVFEEENAIREMIVKDRNVVRKRRRCARGAA